MTQLQQVTGIATSIRMERGSTFVRYHNTDVVRFDDEWVTLQTDGYKTATTKVRMNQAANQFGLKFHVHQSKGKWYVRVGGWGASYGHDVSFLGNSIRIKRSILNGEEAA